MKDIEKISCIAEYLQLDNVVEELKAIDFRSKQENANLILPLVGEFSSGKTTLINALTDCKKLETATKPTTATIYEVHFGCNTCRADVVDENGNIRGVEDIASLKNEELTEAQVVTVFDTSKRVPSNTILVDTPGLSSPDPKHKQMLVNFLPQADGIMLVTDINQQITRSLTDFIETMKLSKRPIYLILTKA
ncbi:MAG: dynamin family protein, partial [Bacteroidaceae bacterium]|nr:dynamin family protein [Bacteroidaceae bacterium]MBQ4462558.1 dynamin family protein [Bacteroidaceae bacterium]